MSNDTLQSILGSKTVSFYSIFAKALGSVQSAVMLSQAFFWQEKARFKSECIEIKGQMFFKKTAEEWYEETGLTQEQQSTARAKLSKCGVMLSELAGLPASLHYWVNMEAVVKMVEQYLKENKKVFVDKRTEKRDKKRSEKGKFEKTSSGKEPEHSIGNLPKQENRIIPQQVDHTLPQQDAVKNGNIYNVESLEKKGELKGEGPLSANGKTEVTLHSPDQVGNTFLHVVENGSLEAESDKDYSGAGPGEFFEQPILENEDNLPDYMKEILEGKGELQRQILLRGHWDEKRRFAKSDQNPGFSKETPASQDAGTFEAECFSNNPPPIFFNPELQRRYNGTAPTNGKARKATAQDRTAQICAELKTTEVLDFFHAIHAAWGEWTAYKRREKKGSYRSAETEAVAIGQLYKKVNGDPAAARDAIEHSIAQTYMGIYPSKDAKPTAEPCARYSMQDGPRATTSEEMTLEISRFYNANKDKYASLLRHPGMERYTVPKLKEAVSLFCASRIKQNRGGETFQQQHAALEQHFLFLIKREREDAAKQAGPQSYNPADLRAAGKRGR